MFLLDDLVREFPAYESKIKELVAKGKLTIGPFYTQFDEWTPSAESMVKNCLYGDRVSRSYGAEPIKIGYLPDNFGHPAQLPQIFKNFDIDSLVFMRGMVDIDKGREFIFIAPDGSEVIAVNYNYSIAFIYSNNDPEQDNPRIIPFSGGGVSRSYDMLKLMAEHKDIKGLAEKMVESARENKKLFSQKALLFPMGCDHCPPQVDLGKTIECANSIQDEFEFIFTTPDEYIKALNKEEIECAYKGDLLGSATDYILLSVLANRINQKIDVYESETLILKYARPIYQALKAMGIKDEKYHALLDNATKKLLINSTHDSIHGACVKEAHDMMAGRSSYAKQAGIDTIDFAFKAISSKLGKWWSDDYKPITIYNPNGKAGVQPFNIWLPIGDKGVEIINKDGQKFTTVINEREALPLNANGLPYYMPSPIADYKEITVLYSGKPFGIETLAWKTVDKEELAISDDRVIENEYLTVKLNGATLTVEDKQSGFVYENLNLIKEIPDAGDIWNYSAPYIDYDPLFIDKSHIESTRVIKAEGKSVIEVVGKYQLPEKLDGDVWVEDKVTNTFKYIISLYKGVKRVDVKIKLSNKAKDHMTLLEIPFDYKTDKIFSKGAFVVNKRDVEYTPKKPWIERFTEMLPFNEWVASTNGDKGLLIATKGLCAYMVENKDDKTVLSIPINRSIAPMSKINMKRRTVGLVDSRDVGAQSLLDSEIEYSIFTFNNGKFPITEEIESFSYPIVGLGHYRSHQYGEYTSNIYCPFEIVGGDVVVSLIDLSYDGKYNLLRFYDITGKNQKVSIKIPSANKVYLADMNENIKEELKLESDTISLDVSACSIKTILWN